MYLCIYCKLKTKLLASSERIITPEKSPNIFSFHLSTNKMHILYHSCYKEPIYANQLKVKNID